MGGTLRAGPRLARIARWDDIRAEAPELVELAEGFFGARTHKTLATLRRDGSPRISGIEGDFRDGELWLGCMWRSLKALDMQRDPRFALHSGSIDPPGWDGDAKVAGLAEEVTDPELVAQVNGSEGQSHLFRADVRELVVVRVVEKQLVVESWHEGRGVTKLERS